MNSLNFHIKYFRVSNCVIDKEKTGGGLFPFFRRIDYGKAYGVGGKIYKMKQLLLADLFSS